MTKILSFNAGLMRLDLLGLPLFQPAPLIPLRYAALAGALAGTGADILALQEVYRRDYKEGLAEALAADYPHVYIPPRPPSPLLDSGLMMVSKHPLRDFTLLRFKTGTPEERWLSYRGWLNGCVETPDVGTLRLLNYHTTAGGLFRDPESDVQNNRRRTQIDEILADAAETPDGETLVLLGDLNAGPPASMENYRQVLGAGFIDTYAPNGDRAGEGYVTWDSQQPLNAKGPHSFQKAQRIDQIFIRRADAASLSLAESQCVLHAADVATKKGDVTVSDHYGVLAELAPAGT